MYFHAPLHWQVKVNSTYFKHKVWPHQPCWLSALLTQCPCGTVQTGTGKVDPARKLKCTTAARVLRLSIIYIWNDTLKNIYDSFLNFTQTIASWTKDVKETCTNMNTNLNLQSFNFQNFTDVLNLYFFWFDNIFKLENYSIFLLHI